MQTAADTSARCLTSQVLRLGVEAAGSGPFHPPSLRLHFALLFLPSLASGSSPAKRKNIKNDPKVPQKSRSSMKKKMGARYCKQEIFTREIL
jgi:hypothetical protein